MVEEPAPRFFLYITKNTAFKIARVERIFLEYGKEGVESTLKISYGTKS